MGKGGECCIENPNSASEKGYDGGNVLYHKKLTRNSAVLSKDCSNTITPQRTMVAAVHMSAGVEKLKIVPLQLRKTDPTVTSQGTLESSIM